MAKENKTEFIKIRLSTKEKSLLKERARNYKSISAFVLHSCMTFDDRMSVMKLDYIEDWLNHYKQYKNELNSLSNNINQVAHYVNTLYRAGILNDNFIQEDKIQREQLYRLLESIAETNKTLEKQFKDFIKHKK